MRVCRGASLSPSADWYSWPCARIASTCAATSGGGTARRLDVTEFEKVAGIAQHLPHQFRGDDQVQVVAGDPVDRRGGAQVLVPGIRIALELRRERIDRFVVIVPTTSSTRTRIGSVTPSHSSCEVRNSSNRS